MSLLSTTLGYWTGMGLGMMGTHNMTLEELDPYASLERLGKDYSSVEKRVTLVALHVLLSLNMIGFYFIVPQIGLPFVATRALQGFLLPTLLLWGSTIEQQLVQRNNTDSGNNLSEFKTWHRTTQITALGIGIIGSLCGIPMIIPGAAVSIGRHLYSLKVTPLI